MDPKIVEAAVVAMRKLDFSTIPNFGLWQLDKEICRRIAHTALEAALSAGLCGEREAQEEKVYKVGVEDGYSSAIQDIDLLTGGDGEYRFCTDHDHDRHTPDAATMKQRIVARFIDREAAIRREALESAARIADEQASDEPYGHAKFRCVSIAENIRALIAPDKGGAS